MPAPIAVPQLTQGLNAQPNTIVVIVSGPGTWTSNDRRVKIERKN